MLSRLTLVALLFGGARAFSQSSAGKVRSPSLVALPLQLQLHATIPTLGDGDDTCPLPSTTTDRRSRRSQRTTTRRDWLVKSAPSALVGPSLASTFGARPAAAAASASRAVTDASSGDLPDLPPNAVQSYLQYRYGLQLAADYYIFDLQSMVGDTDEYGAVSELVASKGARGGSGGASRIEREYVNPMRIIGLSMPPDVADEVRDSQFAFEKAMAKLTKATSGIKRDLPVEIDAEAVPRAIAAWDEGRVALNSFFDTLNRATGLRGELVTIPPPGPNQFREYGRSIGRYNTFMKKTRLCQNRGGPTLSAAWGQLVSFSFFFQGRDFHSA